MIFFFNVSYYVLAAKYQEYLTGESVVDPPYFFANQFGHGVACVVGESLHKVLHGEEKNKDIALNFPLQGKLQGI